MDLNYLYHRKGVAFMMAEQARCRRSESAHRSMADAYGLRIAAKVRSDARIAA